MIEINGLGKAFGLRPVLRGVDLSIATGETLALFGPNGAGKTTLLRIVAGLAKPTTGTVAIGGSVIPDQIDWLRGMIGVVSHQPLIYGELTAEENLRFYARLYDIENAEERIAAVLKRIDLHKRTHDLARTFSRGMQQRLAIGRAILHDPPYLLLDEPYTGLDQAAGALLDEILAEEAGARTVLMTTHNIARGLALADRVAILSKGKIAYEAAADTLDIPALTAMYSDVTGMVGVR